MLYPAGTTPRTRVPHLASYSPRTAPDLENGLSFILEAPSLADSLFQVRLSCRHSNSGRANKTYPRGESGRPRGQDSIQHSCRSSRFQYMPGAVQGASHPQNTHSCHPTWRGGSKPCTSQATTPTEALRVGPFPRITWLVSDEAETRTLV